MGAVPLSTASPTHSKWPAQFIHGMNYTEKLAAWSRSGACLDTRIAPAPPLKVDPGFKRGPETRNSGEGFPARLKHCLHCPFHNLFSALPLRPPLKLFFLLLFSCFHTQACFLRALAQEAPHGDGSQPTGPQDLRLPGGPTPHLTPTSPCMSLLP